MTGMDGIMADFSVVRKHSASSVPRKPLIALSTPATENLLTVRDDDGESRSAFAFDYGETGENTLYRNPES